MDKELKYTIRRESPADYEEVYKMVKEAFLTDVSSDGSEADYLTKIRNEATFIPELSFVAKTDSNKTIGQIVLYKTFIKTNDGDIESLVLSPLSVDVGYFGKGVARMLIDFSLQQAQKMGYKSVFLCGNPRLYQKFGFYPSFTFNIFHKDDHEAQWCMAKELIPGSLDNVSGIIDIV